MLVLLLRVLGQSRSKSHLDDSRTCGVPFSTIRLWLTWQLQEAIDLQVPPKVSGRVFVAGFGLGTGLDIKMTMQMICSNVGDNMWVWLKVDQEG